jgi:hypothetical protein
VQIQNSPVPGNDHVTTYNEWLNIQNGLAPPSIRTFDPVKRYIRTARDLAEWLRVDFTYQGVLNAFNILQAMGAARDAANPYTASATQIEFVTFGPPHFLDLLACAPNAGLRAIAHQVRWDHHYGLSCGEKGAHLLIP